MSAKGDCGHHGEKRRKLFRRIFACILIFLLIVLVIILLVWAILRPTKPNFILQDATVYNFNVTSPTFLTSSFQVTISSRNPNDNIGVYYDKLDVYASYLNEQITYKTSIPPTYQGHNEVNVWSLYVQGNAVPVAPFIADLLCQDQAAGAISLLFKINGRVRWKVGTFTSGHYHMYVRCSASISFGSKQTGIPIGDNAVKYQLARSCRVSV